jgi:hypothetical protein
MKQDVLRVASEDDQAAEGDAGPAPARDARALLDRLDAALSIPGAGPSSDDVPAMTEHAAFRMPSFGKAVIEQATQLQYLSEQIDRLGRDKQVAELRDVLRGLCGTLSDVAFRFKHSSSEADARTALLTTAIAILSGVPDLDAPHDFARILGGAEAVVKRFVLLERLLKDAGTTIVALEDKASRGQTAVRDLSENVAKLNARAVSERSEIAGLGQRMETADRSVAEEFAKVGETIKAERDNIAQLQQRIAAADQISAKGLATVSEQTSLLRNELGQFQERLKSVEDSTVLHAGFREKIEILERRLQELEHNATAEIDGWKTRNAEQFANLMSRVESLELKNQTLSEAKEQTVARLQVAEQALAATIQRQKAWHDRITQTLLANPELP